MGVLFFYLFLEIKENDMAEKEMISSRYNPSEVEGKWYSTWEDRGYFHQEVDKSKEPFSIVMPPPNVTGQLHLGHAMDNTLQDILVRFKRMQGFNTLWIPGTDHAGIATQARVEENLSKEGISKYDLGRDKFLEKVWEWKDTYHERITGQLRLLGSSCDWERERFTMDEGCSKAVREAFVALFEKGLIYKGKYIVNWCPKCHTTISDIEVDYADHDSYLWNIRYKLEDKDEYIVIATTRPETMLGDTAVAVHPEDERYKDMIGKYLILPIVGRRIPVIADDYVDPAFGSGAVKITPAHDPNDFEIAKRHDLEQIVVIDKKGYMSESTGKYAGMERDECREMIVKDLESSGDMVSIDEYSHSVGECYRCGTVIEPLVSSQWFVKMEPLAKPAIKAVLDGETKFIPERFTKVYLSWMENIRDWCISRQLWWGHRIPVWYCDDCGEVICTREDPTVCPKCGGSKIEQDPDVLDTWFSSGLWPFETLGWPDKTEELEQFYPTSVLVTGRDIIFFWVARMIFTALEFQQEVPFKEVFIHGLILDAQGRKMSKSLGNGIDPLEIIDEYGADTLRFMLVTGNTPGNDLKFQKDRLLGIRNFTNKIWNASRFLMMNLDDYEGAVPGVEDLTLEDRWILTQYNRTIEKVTADFATYELGEAAQSIYEFTWNYFCDWYIEMVKPRLYGKVSEKSRQAAQYVLNKVLTGTMALLHPFMPFITEEIWQHLPHEGDSIMISKWPEAEEKEIYESSIEDMECLMQSVRAVRNIRAEMNVDEHKKAPVVLQTENQQTADMLEENQAVFALLSTASTVEVQLGYNEIDDSAAGIITGIHIYMPLNGMINFDVERKRLAKEKKKLDDEVGRLEKKLGNQGFLAKAPDQVVEKEREKLVDYRLKRDAVERSIEKLG
jgi:valyl-tRNA synthetase